MKSSSSSYSCRNKREALLWETKIMRPRTQSGGGEGGLTLYFVLNSVMSWSWSVPL
jgi:hypothetical protein